MANKRGRKSNLIRLEICEDPALQRFGSLSEAMVANVDLNARLIRAGEQQVEESEGEPETTETTSVFEEV